MKKLFTLKVPAYSLLIVVAVSIGASYIFIHAASQEKATLPELNTAKYSTCDIQRIRLHDGNLTSPLLMTDVLNESERLQSLKEEINHFINESKSKNIINDAGIYIRQLNNGSWISINGGNGFHPGSLIKVPVLITYLKVSEKKPGYLDAKLVYHQPNFQVPKQTFEVPSIMKDGYAYSIRQLLYEMVAKSDNLATTLLLQNIDTEGFKSTFTDIGLPEPPLHDMNFQISALDYSKFFRVLYNATYLSRANSELALSILSKSTFKEGIMKSIPDKITVAHKFGEYNDGPYKELHEAGIIYVNNNPYLLTIMSKGNDIKTMPSFLGDVAKIIHNKLQADN
jgi:beta-lactamase class A